jgi:hypothetical protein
MTGLWRVMLAGIGMPFAGINTICGYPSPGHFGVQGSQLFWNWEMIPADTRIPADLIFSTKYQPKSGARRHG